MDISGLKFVRSQILCSVFGWLLKKIVDISHFTKISSILLLSKSLCLHKCEINGIHFRLSCPYTSSQNGKSERKICSINNIIRTLLLHALLPSSFWHHAVEMATYLLNILPSKTINFESPLKMLYLKDPSYFIYECLNVYNILSFFPLQYINFNLALHRVSFLGTR